MKRYWEHLRPNERRVVVIIGLALFIVLNAWKVWPHFNDFRRDSARMQAAEKTLATYRATLAHKSEYETKIRKFLESGGAPVTPEDQAIDLMRFYESSAIQNEVQVQNNSGVRTHTNEFFLDQEMTLNVMAREKGLVGFLYVLGSGNSMVRVRNMSLRPDQSHQQLTASITIVASYQKKVPVKPAAAPAVAKVVASAKPASATPSPVVPDPKPVMSVPKPATNTKPVAPTNHTEPRFLKSAVTNKPGH
jgi:hypothetical protein